MFVFKLDTGHLVRGVDSRRDSLHSKAVLIALSNSKKINPLDPFYSSISLPSTPNDGA
jgi:hypothetical protein